MDRRWLAALVALAALLAGVGWWVVASEPERAPRVRVRPEPVRAVKPAPANVRASLPPPVGIDPPPRPPEVPEPATITSEDRLRMNTIVDEVLQFARADCIEPWLSREGDGDPAEFVFDAVLDDGRLADVGLRSMRLDLPSDVVQCVADRTWYADWPEWDLPGEIRLQRSIVVRPKAPR